MGNTDSPFLPTSYEVTKETYMNPPAEFLRVFSMKYTNSFPVAHKSKII